MSTKVTEVCERCVKVHVSFRETRIAGMPYLDCS